MRTDLGPLAEKLRRAASLQQSVQPVGGVLPRSGYLADALAGMKRGSAPPSSPADQPQSVTGGLADALTGYAQDRRDAAYARNQHLNDTAAGANASAAALGHGPVIPWNPLPTADADQASPLKGLVSLGRKVFGGRTAAGAWITP